MPDEKERKGVTQGDDPRADGDRTRTPGEPPSRDRRNPRTASPDVGRADTPVAGTRMPSSPGDPQDRQRDP